MSDSLIEQVAASSPNRRKFLKTVGLATAAVGAMGSMPKSADAQTMTEIDVLNFALNLEYLEAEFYSYAHYGVGLEAFGIGVDGVARGSNPSTGGTTTGGAKVNFTNQLVKATGEEIGVDERSHVKLLRTALGSLAIAKPNINLNALGIGFANENDYLVLSRAFEDIGVSAYAGAAGLLTTPSIITTAARILAAEAEHVSTVRTQIAILNVPTKPLDAADLVPPPTGSQGYYLSLYRGNGLAATRTPGQVLYLAYGNQANATSGGFFPTGTNGAIYTSSAPATKNNFLS